MRTTRLQIADCRSQIGADFSRRGAGSIRNLQSAICHSPRGVVLLMVLVVVAMLALGAYSFTRLMNLEAQGAKSYGRQVQARHAAESGVHYVAAILADQKQNGILGTDLFDTPSLFQGQLVSGDDAASARQRCRFSIVAPSEAGTNSQSLRYGVTDEAGRINLNVLVDWLKAQAGQSGSGSAGSAGGSGASGSTSTSAATNPLLSLPNMTDEIADAILDWLDPDDDPRANGAESDYYESLKPPYRAKNGPISSLDELLLVRGVTPRLLYGEDANRNGILDPNEDDGDQSYPSDDSNGSLDRGWLPYLTLYSRESNSDATGQSRINLTGDDLDALYSQLSQDPSFSEEKARFIVAYRLFGPAPTMNATSFAITSLDATDSTALVVFSTSGGGSSSSGSSGGSSGAGVSSQGGSGSSGSSGSDSTKIIAGMNASGGAKRKISSVVDLIGVSVNARLAEKGKNGQAKTETLQSPFTDADMSDYLETLLDRTTTSASQWFAGRVNVNTAPSAVLMAVPGMTQDHADAIVAAQPQAGGSAGESSNGGIAWLLTKGTLSKDDFKRLEPYLAGRSQVFRVQSVGYFDEAGPVARVEAVIDVSGASPRVRWSEDLSQLGRGYDLRTLQGTTAR